LNRRYPSITLCVLILITTVISGRAQSTTDRIHDTNMNSWWVYSGDHPVKGPWGVFAEIQIRRSDFASTWQQLQSRDAVTYRFSPHVQVLAGYVFTRTARYGDFPAIHSSFEHRIFEQATIKQDVKKVELEHRLRNEQRWIQSYSSSTDFIWHYQNRFRYQFKTTVPLTKADQLGHQWYLFGGDELFFPYGPDHGPNWFDQNRAFGGLGYKFTKNNKFEVSYLNQWLIQRNDRIEEVNHTLRVQWTSTTPMGKLFR
jgi:hypothetical protein